MKTIVWLLAILCLPMAVSAQTHAYSVGQVWAYKTRPADDGIAQWRRDHGGVFTISIAATIDVLDETLRRRSGG